VTTPAAQNATSNSLPLPVDALEAPGQDPQGSQAPENRESTTAPHLRPGSVRTRPRSRTRAERAHGRAEDSAEADGRKRR
jgi:hypothetical protein